MPFKAKKQRWDGQAGLAAACDPNIYREDTDPRLNWLVSFGLCDVKDGVLINWRAIRKSLDTNSSFYEHM